ncbi:28_t:CDS:2 [Paraglomus brasilianum]|uniref:28_t:CDS:1 n=1 Tax=Paraglomus brasilianum TaxID=144538 RepID=A0A9N8ZKF3_9GLOM|nr:28_t:CDS:2 [Paraglomus brasilianum]
MFPYPDSIPWFIQFLANTCGLALCSGAVEKPSKYGMEYDDITLKTVDNVRLKAYICKQVPDEVARNSPTLLFYHANAGNMGHRLPIAQVFYKRFKWNVAMLSYRGYGLSEGSPNEEGMRIDAQTMLDYVKNDDILKDTRIIAFGQSIGGAVAIDLVSRNEDKACPRTDHREHIPEYFWSSETAITKIKYVPILFLSGSRDGLVPPQHMKTLYELAQTRKRWRPFLRGEHNDTAFQPGYYDTIEDFAETFCNIIIERDEKENVVEKIARMKEFIEMT